MIVNHDLTAENAPCSGDVPADQDLPHCVAGGFRDDHGHPLALVDHALDEHEGDKGFPETDAVAKQRPVIPVGNAQELAVGVLLIFAEDAIDGRMLLFPDAGRDLPAAEIFVQ